VIVKIKLKLVPRRTLSYWQLLEIGIDHLAFLGMSVYNFPMEEPNHWYSTPTKT
jgi:hypothetical protein